MLLILCAGMVEVFPFEIDSRPAAVLAQTFGEVQGGRPAHVVPIQFGQLFVEPGLGDRLVVVFGKLVQGVNKRFGHIAAAEGPKAADGIGNAAWWQTYK